MRFTLRHFLLGVAVAIHLGLSLSLGFMLAFIGPPTVLLFVGLTYAGGALYWRRHPWRWLLPHIALDLLTLGLWMWRQWP